MKTFSLQGDLSFETVAQWWPQLQSQINGEALSLDLNQVARADSAGLALLVSAMASANERKTSLQLQGAPAQLRQLAKVSGVDHLLPFVGA